MAKTRTQKRSAADEIEEMEELEEDLEDVEYDDEDVEELESEAVISDSRARRKRKRGELVESPSTEKKNRATPSRRKSTKAAAAQPTNVFQRTIQRIPIVRGFYNYFVAVMAEMSKVTWPSREDTMRMTRMVLAVTGVFSAALGLLDVFYSWWFRQGLEEDTVFLGVAAVVTLVGAVFTWFVFIRQDEYSPF